MVDNSPRKIMWELFTQLRRYGFPLSPDDYENLRQALKAGFGLSSREALCDLCCALWSKSKREKTLLESLFNQRRVVEWDVSESELIDQSEPETGELPPKPEFAEMEESIETAKSPGGLPPLHFDDLELPDISFVFTPQFPLTEREIAQAWRRLRKPVRFGPPVELDIDATISSRCRSGVVSDVVLVPRRRNTARLLILVDRQGSMTPFHRFVDHVVAAICQSGRLESVATYYFHDIPAEGADETVLGSISDQLFPEMDSILSKIMPLSKGCLYDDPSLLAPIDMMNMLEKFATAAAIVIISDAGAARGKYDVIRLLDTIAFLKTLHEFSSTYVWLNPLPIEKYWDTDKINTARQIARHVPMFPMNQTGVHQAVNVLRGQPYAVERSI